MANRDGIKIRDSEGNEEQAKENFILFNNLLIEKKARLTLAKQIGVSATAIYKYAENGKISRYTTEALSKIFAVDRGYFNGKIALKKESDVYKKIEEISARISKYGALEEDRVGVDSIYCHIEEKDINTSNLKSAIKESCSYINYYDKCTLLELKDLCDLFEKNIKILKSKIEIIDTVQESYK